MRKWVLIALVFNIQLVGFSQSDKDYYPGKKEREEENKNATINKRIELLAETSEAEDFDLTNVFDQLYYFIDHPINLNFTSREELELLQILDNFQINNLLEHIKKNGRLMTIYELQAIEGFDLDIIQAILPFVKVNAELDSPHISFQDILKNGNSELFIRYTRVLEEMVGYSAIDDSVLAANPNKRYLGSPDKLYARYRFKFGTNISLGLTGEKDPGEEFFKGTQKQGFDFYSGHLYFKDIGKIKHLALGDYQIMLGQGLTFWSARAFNKSADVINVKKNGRVIAPYTSVDENLFMRGAAGSVKINKFEVTGFYSRKGRDANVVEVDTASGDAFLITSEMNSGIHATPAQLEDKNTLVVSHLGTNVAYKGRNLQVGATGVFAGASSAITASNTSPYAQFKSTGSPQQLNFGLDYNYVIRNFNFFGEASHSVSGGSAFLSGAMIALDPRLSVSVLYRYFDVNYYHMMVNPFRESNARNEKGLYIGAEAKLSKAFTFSGYFDRFEYPWLRYQVDAPSKGFDYIVQLTYKPSKKLEMYFRYKQEVKDRNGKIELVDTTSSGFFETSFGVYEGIKELVGANRQDTRYNLKYKISDAVSLGNRVQYSQYRLGDNTPQSGLLIYQDISFHPLSSNFSFTARFALFDTEGWDSRIYAYENDVLYYFAVPAYYNRGARAYITVRYRVIKGIDVWMRIAQTYYTNDDQISTGMNQINNNTKTEVRAQVRFKF